MGATAAVGTVIGIYLSAPVFFYLFSSLQRHIIFMHKCTAFNIKSYILLFIYADRIVQNSLSQLQFDGAQESVSTSQKHMDLKEDGISI